jgi:outer membrane lipoprotein-sorting protein
LKRIVSAILLLMAMILVLSGCGQKGSKDVVKDLGDHIDKMSGYKMNAVLTLQTGKEPQAYNVEVWHNKPDLYRVALTSEQKDITQIILRNNEGVFVLTPHLNKSFRFQSGWPENHGQVYLYESLVRSIINDPNRVFKDENGKYVFEVKADYQNRSLSTQRIWLTHDLVPVKVDVLDSNKTPMVTVDFSNFKLNAKFDGDSFSKERNMQTSMLGTVPTLAGAKQNASESFGVIEPSYLPKGVTYSGVEKVKGEDGDKVVLRYKGKYHLTLIEERPKASTVTYPSGDVVDLGSSVGVLTGDEMLTMSWTHDGVEYLLTGAVPKDEMIAVAKSTLDQVGK